MLEMTEKKYVHMLMLHMLMLHKLMIHISKLKLWCVAKC